MQLSVKDKQRINTRKEKVIAKEYVLMQTFEKECDKLTLDSNIGTFLESSEVSLGLLYYPCRGGQA
jgi:hypothetical protein